MEEGKNTARSVERALDILLCFTDSQEYTLTDLSKRVSLHKSTVYRILASLEGKGFVVRNNETEKYRLGFRIWELSASLSRGDDPAAILLPEMEKLRDAVGETISLYIRDGRDRLRIQAVQSHEAVRRVAPIGARMPLYVGAASKVLMAFETEAAVRSVMDAPDWPRETEPDLFWRQLEEVRGSGYATSFEERERGAAAVAAPIIARSDKLVAALSVSGPASRLTESRAEEIAPEVKEAARRMSQMVG